MRSVRWAELYASVMTHEKGREVIAEPGERFELEDACGVFCIPTADRARNSKLYRS
jgi:hypothetical protein